MSYRRVVCIAIAVAVWSVLPVALLGRLSVDRYCSSSIAWWYCAGTSLTVSPLGYGILLAPWSMAGHHTTLWATGPVVLYLVTANVLICYFDNHIPGRNVSCRGYGQTAPRVLYSLSMIIIIFVVLPWTTARSEIFKVYRWTRQTSTMTAASMAVVALYSYAMTSSGETTILLVCSCLMTLVTTIALLLDTTRRPPHGGGTWSLDPGYCVMAGLITHMLPNMAMSAVVQVNGHRGSFFVQLANTAAFNFSMLVIQLIMQCVCTRAVHRTYVVVLMYPILLATDMFSTLVFATLDPTVFQFVLMSCLNILKVVARDTNMLGILAARVRVICFFSCISAQKQTEQQAPRTPSQVVLEDEQVLTANQRRFDLIYFNFLSEVTSTIACIMLVVGHFLWSGVRLSTMMSTHTHPSINGVWTIVFMWIVHVAIEVPLHVLVWRLVGYQTHTTVSNHERLSQMQTLPNSLSVQVQPRPRARSSSVLLVARRQSRLALKHIHAIATPDSAKIQEYDNINDIDEQQQQQQNIVQLACTLAVAGVHHQCGVDMPLHPVKEPESIIDNSPVHAAASNADTLLDLYASTSTRSIQHWRYIILSSAFVICVVSGQLIFIPGVVQIRSRCGSP
jgi:hypothetical protein